MASVEIAGLERQVRLQQVIKLSENMVEQAGRGEWEQIAELERQRRDDMMAALRAPLQEDETQQVHDSLQQLVQLNGQLTAMVQQARDDSVRQFNELRSGRDATKAYQRVGEQK